MSDRTWTCQRQAGGIKCQHKNPTIKRKCGACGKPRPARKRPKHMAALDIPYDRYVEINGGEHCGICGAPPKGRRLNRDHDHNGAGKARGLLCAKCNRSLIGVRYGLRITPEWLRAAVGYLERTI